MKKTRRAHGPFLGVAAGMGGGATAIMLAVAGCPVIAPFAILGGIFVAVVTKLGVEHDMASDPESEAADRIASKWESNRFDGEDGIDITFSEDGMCRKTYRYEKRENDYPYPYKFLNRENERNDEEDDISSVIRKPFYPLNLQDEEDDIFPTRKPFYPLMFQKRDEDDD